MEMTEMIVEAPPTPTMAQKQVPERSVPQLIDKDTIFKNGWRKPFRQLISAFFRSDDGRIFFAHRPEGGSVARIHVVR